MTEEKKQHIKKERTFVMIKPDGIQRSLIGEIISRFERTGLRFVAFKFFVPDEKRLWKHYNKDDKWFIEKGENAIKDRKEAGIAVEKEAIEYGKDIVRQLVSFMSAGPVLAIVLEGNQSVGIIKKLVGGTEPLTSDVGTIRGDLTIDSYALSGIDGRAVRNLIHCSDKPEEAKKEMDIWMDKEDFINYNIAQDKIIYDVNLDGILE
jgi:nucleoside-diphosphate kinase